MYRSSRQGTYHITDIALVDFCLPCTTTVWVKVELNSSHLPNAIWGLLYITLECKVDIKNAFPLQWRWMNYVPFTSELRQRPPCFKSSLSACLFGMALHKLRTYGALLRTYFNWMLWFLDFKLSWYTNLNHNNRWWKSVSHQHLRGNERSKQKSLLQDKSFKIMQILS